MSRVTWVRFYGQNRFTRDGLAHNIPPHQRLYRLLTQLITQPRIAQHEQVTF